MTQEREAMERLLNFAKDAYSNWDCDHACARGGACRCCKAEAVIRHAMGDLAESFLNGPYFGTSDEIVAALESLGAPVDHLSRHARALQPITVGAFKKLGAKWNPQRTMIGVVLPNGACLACDNEMKNWFTGLSERVIDMLPLDYWLAPQTMLDVEQLIERLSR